MDERAACWLWEPPCFSDGVLSIYTCLLWRLGALAIAFEPLPESVFFWRDGSKNVLTAEAVAIRSDLFLDTIKIYKYLPNYLVKFLK